MTYKDYIKDYLPMSICRLKVIDTGIIFSTATSTVDISFSNKMKKYVSDFIFECNGISTFETIFNNIGNIKDFGKTFMVLAEYKIIVDAREFYITFNESSSIPMPYGRDLEDLEIFKLKNKSKEELMHKNNNDIILNSNTYDPSGVGRKSTRSFNVKKTISKQKVIDLLVKMYSRVNSKAVPSAGGFYPLEIYLIVLRSGPGLKKGIYSYNGLNTITFHRDNFSVKEVIFSLGTYIVENAYFVTCITGNHKNLAKKYSNRAYRYLLLEAGHVAQNAYLFSAENDIGVVEYGGFNDTAITKILNLDSDTIPIITIIFGVENINDDKAYQEKFKEEFKKVRGVLERNKLLKGLNTTVYNESQYIMPRYTTCSKYLRYRSKKSAASFGTGLTVFESNFKAVMESYERYCSGLLRVDCRAAESELGDNTFIYNNYYPQHPRYIKANNMDQFDKNETISWTKAIKLNSGSDILIPSQQVFYPIIKDQIKEKIYYKSNSTGVAAHFDYSEAIKNATFELIERDAVMITWHTKTSPNKIDVKFLDISIQNRVIELKKQKKDVSFLDITLDTCSVVMCVITSSVYPKVSTGCCAHIDIFTAATKAIDEAEYINNSWKDSNRPIVKMNDVKGATDHGNYFGNKGLYNKKYEWLVAGKSLSKPKSSLKSLKKIYRIVDPIVVDISDKKQEDIYVVRVFSKNLLPFSFGYGSEHIGQRRFDMLNLIWDKKYPSDVHLIA